MTHLIDNPSRTKGRVGRHLPRRTYPPVTGGWRGDPHLCQPADDQPHHCQHLPQPEVAASRLQLAPPPLTNQQEQDGTGEEWEEEVLEAWREVEALQLPEQLGVPDRQGPPGYQSVLCTACSPGMTGATCPGVL